MRLEGVRVVFLFEGDLDIVESPLCRRILRTGPNLSEPS